MENNRKHNNFYADEFMIFTSRGISGAILKWIALISMVIDHVAAASFVYAPLAFRLLSISWIVEIYYLMRFIGRLAFPLFAFLIAEGFYYTKSRYRQLLSLIIFGIISQLPYRYCLGSAESWDFNIMLTLAWCYLALIFYDWGMKRLGISFGSFKHPVISSFLANLECTLFLVFTAGVFGTCSYFLRLDYDWGAVLMILAFYVLRKRRVIAVTIGIGFLFLFMMLRGSFSYTLALLVPWALLLIYNGQRGKQNKWVFYWFYPVHLLVIILLRYLIYYLIFAF